jgi:hypothetical protein
MTLQLVGSFERTQAMSALWNVLSGAGQYCSTRDVEPWTLLLWSSRDFTILTHRITTEANQLQVIPCLKAWTTLWGAYCLEPLEHSDHGFESRSRHGCISSFSCVVLSCKRRGFVLRWSSVQGVLPKQLNGFIVSEVNSESEQAKRHNPWSVQLCVRM